MVAQAQNFSPILDLLKFEGIFGIPMKLTKRKGIAYVSSKRRRVKQSDKTKR